MAKIFRVIIPAGNIEQSFRFYRELLGQPGRRVSPGRHYFDCDGVILACFDPRADGDDFDARPNPDHIYFSAPNVDELFERARQLNCQTIDPKVARRPWGERSFYLKDPFGNPICFVDEQTVFSGLPKTMPN